MKVSVALASYNGEKYIEEQLRSCLLNLGPEDEIIVSDDNSTDRTRETVNAVNDSRVRLIDGPGKGVKQNFANAVSKCTGDYIFLCDQDDVWEPDKVSKVLNAFKEHKVSVVVHNCYLTGEDGAKLLDSYFDYRGSGSGFLKNIVKNSFMGCCMAFEASLKDRILPIPDDIEMHDQWIGLLGEKEKGTFFLDEKLINYRRHENNASDCFNHYGTLKMISNRLHLIRRLINR